MPFAHLGVPADADERAVRRAYARLLKQTRPDDDPQAFQLLHEAYQECLARIARRRYEEAGDDDCADDVDDGPVLAADPAPPPPIPQRGERIEPLPVAAVAVAVAVAGQEAVAEPVAVAAAEPLAASADDLGTPREFDFAAFIDELLARAWRDSPKAMSQWLYAHPDLYSFRLKQMLAVDVLRIVAEQERPVPAAMLDALAAFFGVDDVGPSGWWLRERIQQARDSAALRERFRRRPLPRINRHQTVRWIDEQVDAELLEPPAWWRSALLLLVPGQIGQVNERIRELDHLGGDVAIEAMVADKRELYLALADRARGDWRRLLVSVARTALYGGIALLLVAWAGADVARNGGAIAALGGGFLASHLLAAGWHRGVAALQARMGSWERELSVAVLLLVGTVVVAAPGTAWTVAGTVGYGLLVAGVLRALTIPRSLVGLLIGGLLLVVEGVVRESTWPGFGVPTLWATAALTLALDRVLAWRSGLDPLVHAANPRPLQYLLLALFVLAVGALFAAQVLFPPT